MESVTMISSSKRYQVDYDMVIEDLTDNPETNPTLRFTRLGPKDKDNNTEYILTRGGILFGGDKEEKIDEICTPERVLLKDITLIIHNSTQKPVDHWIKKFCV